jgi:hypothetical protein
LVQVAVAVALLRRQQAPLLAVVAVRFHIQMLLL